MGVTQRAAHWHLGAPALFIQRELLHGSPGRFFQKEVLKRDTAARRVQSKLPR